MNLADELKLRLEFGRHVKIDHGTLDRMCRLLASRVKSDKYRPYDWRNGNHFPDDAEGVATVSQFFAIGNSVNFRYWWLDSEGRYHYCEGSKGGVKEKGAYYMWRAIRLCMKENRFALLDARELEKFKQRDIKRIFLNDDGHTVMPNLEERLRNWRDLGRKLHEYWGGEFHNLIRATKGSLYDFVQYSRMFRAFDDPLCKLTIVNALMHQGRGIIKFDKPIFPGIDYELLKQQMRSGILVLDEQLKAKVTNNRLLTQAEARELRNAGLHAFLVMMKNTSISGDVIDNMWWHNRMACDTERPACQVRGQENGCLFFDVCQKKTEHKIPLEDTRYY